MKILFGIIGILVVLAGCSQYGYRYQPHLQNWTNPIFADYRKNGEQTDILVDTNGFKLLGISISTASGTSVNPKSMDYPPFEDQLLQGNGMYVHGPSFAKGPTIAHFNSQEIGQPPWAVHIEIRGIHPEVIDIPK